MDCGVHPLSRRVAILAISLKEIVHRERCLRIGELLEQVEVGYRTSTRGFVFGIALEAIPMLLYVMLNL